MKSTISLFTFQRRINALYATKYHQAVREGNGTAVMKEEYETHQARKVRSRLEKETNKEKAKSSTNMFVATFDLQSILYTACT